jgi:glycosyltransferase involved in cell wall biosynthesis
VSQRELDAPELSVVIPVYNRPAEAVRAIESVCSQQVEDIEILVVDDGSDPPLALPQILTDDPRLCFLRHAPNRGAAAARNAGLCAARGTWVAFLDSDDCWLPGTLAPRLADARRAAAAGADPLLVYVAGFEYRRAAGERTDIRMPVAAADPLDFASGCWFSPGSTALFLREPILSRVGLQDERLRRFEDVDWFLRLALAGGGIAVHPIVVAQLGSGSRPSAATVEQQGRLVLQNFAAAGDRKSMRRIRGRLCAWLAFELASAYWHEGDYQATLVNLLRSWWLAPRLSLYLRRFWQRQAVT